VTDIIIASLLVDSTPVPRKVARLHLICDILHNSATSVPSAWKFRQEFQARLGIVFDHMANIYHSFPGRITADIFKKQITSVVDVWDDWIVFPPDFTTMLRKRLEGSSASMELEVHRTPDTIATETKVPYSSRFKTSVFREASVPSGDNDVDGEPMDEIDGQPIDGGLDGVPVETDDLYSGPPNEDIDGEPMEDDVDGMPMSNRNEDDLDGEPMEDIDGVPIED
jgi:U2-associated protein SR140